MRPMPSIKAAVNSATSLSLITWSEGLSVRGNSSFGLDNKRRVGLLLAGNSGPGPLLAAINGPGLQGGPLLAGHKWTGDQFWQPETDRGAYFGNHNGPGPLLAG